MDKLIKVKGSHHYNIDLKTDARKLRNNMTKHEKILWYNFLKNRKPKFKRQKIVDFYIVDFFCAKAKLIIEIDGNSHFDSKQEIYDEKRTKTLEKYDLKVIRFTNSDIENDFDNVCNKILENLK